MNFREYFESLRTGDYQIDNFKDFVKHTGFKYTVPSIHVAGTNGKGSTSNYLASIYKEFGLKVGLFTSPFLWKENEMISINGDFISDEEFEKLIKENEKNIKKYDLSAFEVQTLICFQYFMNQKCDIAIIECGMGGEYDATNIFTAILSVITSIEIEHTSQLGRSISEIAYHKAGIINKRVPVVCGDLNDEAMGVINEVALSLDSKVIKKVDPTLPTLTKDGFKFSYLTFKDVQIQSKAFYSVIDACIALEVITALRKEYPVSDEQVLNGLKNVYMDCRMDFIAENPLILVDGAHNPEGINKLKMSLEGIDFGTGIRVVFACFKDKNMQSMLGTLGEVVDEITLTTFDNPRARQLEDYFLFADDYKYMDNPLDVVQYYKENYPNDVILITGSLAFAAYMKNLLKGNK